MSEQPVENQIKKVDVKIDMTSLVVNVDTNQDGQPVATINLSMSEAIGEAMSAFKKGDKPAPIAIDAKAVNLVFDGSKMMLEIDTDKDGERLALVTVDLAEAFDEIAGK